MEKASPLIINNLHRKWFSEFEGLRVLVTGGTQGIGDAVVKRLNQGGARVIAAARKASPPCSAEHFVQADLSTTEGTDRVIGLTLDYFGGIDILVNGVGGTQRR